MAGPAASPSDIKITHRHLFPKNSFGDVDCDFEIGFGNTDVFLESLHHGKLSLNLRLNWFAQA